MKRALLGGLVGVAFLLPAPAAGHTTLTGPGATAAMQAIVDQARVPTPDLEIEVRSEWCEAAPEREGCASPPDRIVWLAPSLDTSTQVGAYALLHEIGHTFDYWELSDFDRGRFSSLLGRSSAPGWGWDWGSYAPSSANWLAFEVFADAYATCAQRRAFGRGAVFFSFYRRRLGAPAARLRQVCHLIVRSYWR